MAETCGLCGAVISTPEDGIPVPRINGPPTWICNPYCRGGRRRLE